MLKARSEAQRDRTPGFTPMYRKPPGHIQKDYNPAGEKMKPEEAKHIIDVELSAPSIKVVFPKEKS